MHCRFMCHEAFHKFGNGASYSILPDSANGTEYEMANGDTLEDLGEKKMVVFTAEGT